MSDFQHYLPHGREPDLLHGQEPHLPQGREGPRATDDLYRQLPVKGR